MSSVVADTHTIIWYLRNSSKLSVVARETLDRAIQAGDLIYISAISFVEIVYLVEKGRIPNADFTNLLKLTSDFSIGIAIAPLNLEVAIAIQQIPRETVPEMPDRIIAATAFSLNLPLITCDHKVQALANVQTVW
ncbi:type II toxin-antitoxin system VapC family toxin [Leptolyngbya sp. DQ-M1]|uniref:type II toxin-antitoxin system VapC family toxin n=1 Tax=Leptolyngbya sp. DQ-M1 TaxID=2933920 RepID=UPI00329800AC